MSKVCIIGGGISGLTLAFLLKNKGFEVVLQEKSARAGGNLETVEIDGFLIEYAANSLLKSPRLVDLIKQLKLETEVLPANAVNRNRYVLQAGRLRALPVSLAAMAFGSFFSPQAKLRLLGEPLVRTKSPDGESVAAFFERRLGREIVEKAADPFIAGIYAGDPQKLSIKAAFPRLYELERDYGSILLGGLRSRAEQVDASFPRTFSFKNGVQTLTDRLAAELGESIRTNTEVKQIEPQPDGRWLVKSSAGAELFDVVTLATPAGPAARLVEKLDARLSGELQKIFYPPVALIFFGVKKESVAAKLDGFGFLVPSAERRRILGTIWNSAVFENRAPVGYDLLTSFVGGARSPELFEKTDEELYEIVFRELQDILGLRARPAFRHLRRWPKAIPQYAVGYENTERAIENFAAANRGIYFCSNFYKGISVGDCVKNAYRTADEIEEFLKDQ